MLSRFNERAKDRKTRAELEELLERPCNLDRIAEHRGLKGMDHCWIDSNVLAGKDRRAHYRMVIHGLKRKHVDMALHGDDLELIQKVLARCEVRYTIRGWCSAKFNDLKERVKRALEAWSDGNP